VALLMEYSIFKKYIYIYLLHLTFFLLIIVNSNRHSNLTTDVAGKSVTAVSRAWGWKTCKIKKLIGKEHRFGAGLGGSDAFVSTSCQRKLESLSL
jgi:hypothetical protein